MSAKELKYNFPFLVLDSIRNDCSFARLETEFLFYKTMKNTINCYGSESIPTAYCKKCKQNSFIINNKYTCCNAPADNPTYHGYKRISTDDGRRRLIPESLKKLILEDQEYCCYYCLVPFSFEVERHGKLIKRKIEFDHLVPFSYLNNNDKENLVASCDICNKLKYSMCFQTTDEARIYLQEKRESKGYNF